MNRNGFRQGECRFGDARTPWSGTQRPGILWAEERMKTITLEEHFVTAEFLKATNAYGEHVPPAMQAMRGKLLDLGEGRIAAMDEGGVDVEVLSLAASGIDDLKKHEQTSVLRGVHNELAAAVKARPDRFAAFCSPGLKEPAEAVKELQRCVTELGFVGAMFDGTVDVDGIAKFLDAPEFFPVLEAAAALRVPIYVHPAPPPAEVRKAYFSGLDEEAGYLLSIAGWGWHAEMGLHLLRLIVSGVLDKLPELQVIVGHMGEGIPYALARSNGVLSGVTKGRRSVAEVMKQQVWVTTSGYFSRPPFDCCRQVLGLDRMMYSVDYPFSPNTRGKDYLAQLDLTPAELEAFAGGTAARLLKL
jgi:predicted TIM-barrel fold metal-dependent hydrolase